MQQNTAEAVSNEGVHGSAGGASGSGAASGPAPEGDIFWSPLGAFFVNYPGTAGEANPAGLVQEDAGGSGSGASGSQEVRRGERTVATEGRPGDAGNRALSQYCWNRAL
eukprot:16444480-Heterocapsa_arctica.AAC.1